jgi:hypothetical protein
VPGAFVVDVEARVREFVEAMRPVQCADRRWIAAIRLRLGLAALAVVPVFLAGCGGGGGSPKAVVVDLVDRLDSGISGTATLTSTGGQPTISISVTGAAGRAPAHVHTGSSCTFFGPVANELNELVGGASEATVDASLESLTDGNHVVDVHAEDESDDPSACGAIPAASA